MMYGLHNDHLALLEDLVVKPLQAIQACIWIFGSRARGDHKKFSDVDILFQVPKADIPSGLIFDIKSRVEDSRLPFKVDLVHVDDIAGSYRASIIKERRPWGEPPLR